MTDVPEPTIEAEQDLDYSHNLSYNYGVVEDVVSAAATLTGSGNVSATGRQSYLVSATLTGGGNLTATESIGVLGTATLTGGAEFTALGFDPGVQYQITRNQTAVEQDLFDVEIVDTANPFGNYAIAYIADNEGDAFEDYPRGTRVDFAYSTNQGTTFTNRFTGYVVERRELDRQGTDSLEVECYSFDQFLRRDTVSTDLSGQTITSALESIITNDTPVSWDATNVTVADPQTLTQSYRGDKVENAIQSIAGKSGNEAFGVNSDLEFYFRPRENAPAPRDIDNTQWFNYDIPERGKGSVNQVTVFYNDGNESVTVDDGADKLDLQNSLGTGDPITLAEEVNRPDITTIEDARAVGQQILNEREPTLTGTVTTYGLLDANPGDVIDITIIPRGIDGAFRIAEIEYNWSEATTTLTIVEKRGNQDRLLVNLSDTLKRTEMQGANRDATGNVVTSTSIGAIVTPDGSADTVDFDAQTITNTARNKLRDAWAGNGNLQISEIAVGDGTDSPQRTDTNLVNELERVSVTETLPDSVTAEYAADVTTTNIREIGLFDSTGDLISRATIPDSALSSPVTIAYSLTVSNNGNIPRGVLTDTGQTSVRDTIADNSPNLPINYAYGTDGTTPQETDTALGNQIVSVSIDELLVQAVNDDSAWDGITPTFSSDEPLESEGGFLRTLQSNFVIEAEDASNTNAVQVGDGAYSNGAYRRIDANGVYIEWTFTPTYEIPASDFDFRYRAGFSSNTTDQTVNITLSGGSFSGHLLTDGSLGAGTSPSWFDIQITQPPANLQPGTTYTLRIEQTSGSTDSYVDLVSLGDGRFSYNYDNNLDANGYLSGPELYPTVQEVTFDSVMTQREFDAARVSQSWNDTTGNQYIELSNDGGSTWQTLNNTDSGSVTFSSASTQLQTRVGLDRWGSRTTATPTTGFDGQEIDTHNLFADIFGIAPDDTGEAIVEAIVQPNTINGQTIREGGQLDSGNNLLSRSIFADIDVLTDQRIISAETVSWDNP